MIAPSGLLRESQSLVDRLAQLGVSLPRHADSPGNHAAAPALHWMAC